MCEMSKLYKYISVINKYRFINKKYECHQCLFSIMYLVRNMNYNIT